MQISARSYMTAGLTAVVSAGAIAMTPALPGGALQTAALPSSAIAEIALTGTSLPLEQIWTLLQTVGNAGSLNGLVDVVFSAVGTEFITQALPLVTAVAADVATYLGSALTGVLNSGSVQIDFPGILSGVGTALGAGNFPGAVQALTGGLAAPITQVVSTVFGTDFQAFLTTKVGTVLGALPELLRSAVQKVLGLDIKPVTDAITMVLAGLVPSVSPAASTPVPSVSPAASAPVALDDAATIGSTVPAIRPSEPAPVAGLEAAVPAGDAAAEARVSPAPAEPAAGDVPSPVVEAPALVTSETEEFAFVTSDAVAAEPDLAGSDLRGPRVAYRGAAEAAGEESPAATKTAPRHRGGA